MKKAIWLTTFASFLTILYFVLFVKSFEFYHDEYGRDISFDKDHMNMLIVACTLLITGILNIIFTYKKKNTFEINFYGFLIVGLVMCVCPFGEMLRAIAKEKATSVIVDYLLWSIIGAFIVAYVVIYYIDNKKQKQVK